MQPLCVKKFETKILWTIESIKKKVKCNLLYIKGSQTNSTFRNIFINAQQIIPFNWNSLNPSLNHYHFFFERHWI